MGQQNINIWALEKDRSIRHLLLLLKMQLGDEAFLIDLSRSCDRCAIFLQHPRDPELNAYLYTLGQPEGHYGLHLEYPSTDGIERIEVEENLKFATLAELLAVHFDVPSLKPLPGR